MEQSSSCNSFRNSFDAFLVRWLPSMEHPCLVSIYHSTNYLCQALTTALACTHPLHWDWTPEDSYLQWGKGLPWGDHHYYHGTLLDWVAKGPQSWGCLDIVNDGFDFILFVVEAGKGGHCIFLIKFLKKMWNQTAQNSSWDLSSVSQKKCRTVFFF